MKDICEELPRRLKDCKLYHSHLTTVVPGEEGEEFRLVLNL